MLLFPAVSRSRSCTSCVVRRYSQPVEEKLKPSGWTTPRRTMTAPASESSRRSYLHHGSAARGAAAAAGRRRRNLRLHISHILLVQHPAAACSRRPPLSPRQQNLHRPEDLLQEVSVCLAPPGSPTNTRRAHPMRPRPSAAGQEVKRAFPDERWSVNVTSENRM